MFLSANALVVQYGIDERIAKFFVDREPPKDNLYWKGKLLYLRPQPGYIFLPLITDLYFRSGISLDQLLNDDYVGLLEQIGHYSAQQEFHIISEQQAIEISAALVDGHPAAEPLLGELKAYFAAQDGNPISAIATPFRALHRGDLFLFSLCALEADAAKKIELVRTWFALISTLLLLDDAEDYNNDRDAGDENAFVESGSNREGFDRIKQLLAANLDHLAAINRTMANALHLKFGAMADKPGIKEYLNA